MIYITGMTCPWLTSQVWPVHDWPHRYGPSMIDLTGMTSPWLTSQVWPVHDWTHMYDLFMMDLTGMVCMIDLTVMTCRWLTSQVWPVDDRPHKCDRTTTNNTQSVKMNFAELKITIRQETVMLTCFDPGNANAIQQCFTVEMNTFQMFWIVCCNFVTSKFVCTWFI